MKAILISAIKLLSSEIERTHFTKKVREQIIQAKFLLDSALPHEESKIRSGLVLLQSAINDISTNSFHSSLYFLGNYRKDNIYRYNELCSLIAAFYAKLGDVDLYDYWNSKIIEIVEHAPLIDDPVDNARMHYDY